MCQKQREKTCERSLGDFIEVCVSNCTNYHHKKAFITLCMAFAIRDFSASGDAGTVKCQNGYQNFTVPSAVRKHLFSCASLPIWFKCVSLEPLNYQMDLPNNNGFCLHLCICWFCTCTEIKPLKYQTFCIKQMKSSALWSDWNLT